MLPNLLASKRNTLSIALGGTLLLVGGVGILSFDEPSLYSASDSEYDYQELLVEMDGELENIYGETPSDEMGFLDFMDQQDISKA